MNAVLLLTHALLCVLVLLAFYSMRMCRNTRESSIFRKKQIRDAITHKEELKENPYWQKPPLPVVNR